MSSVKSPFPGMDPYLERPSGWRGVHTRLIVVISNLINEGLPDNFAVQIEGRLRVLDQSMRGIQSDIIPDLFLKRHDPIRAAQMDAVAIAHAVEIKPIFVETIEERWLEIVDQDNQQVVTTIEILSPFNKRGDGYDQFEKKRKEVVAAGSSWLEIDLLRAGKRPFSILSDADYYAMMVRTHPREWLAWPMMLEERLLTIGVPLSEGYDDIPLNLQTAIDNVYRDGRYARTVRYDEHTPTPVLTAAKQTWVAEQITKWQQAA